MVVVVEAGRTYGPLITAGLARRYGRPVFAVPGPVGAATHLGANRLIARGEARLLPEPVDLLDALSLRAAGNGIAPSPAANLLELFAAGPLGLDEVARALGLEPAQAAGAAADLVISGELVPTGDGRFARR